MSALPIPRGLEQAHDLATLIARSRRLVWSAAAHRLEGRGESMLAWQVLNKLRLDGALSQCELAARTGQHAAGISRLLETLEEAGDVRRTRDRRDRRKRQVALTARGTRRLSRMDPEVAAAAEEAFAPLRAGERRTLGLLLGKLLGGAR